MALWYRNEKQHHNDQSIDHSPPQLISLRSYFQNRRKNITREKDTKRQKYSEFIDTLEKIPEECYFQDLPL